MATRLIFDSVAKMTNWFCHGWLVGFKLYKFSTTIFFVSFTSIFNYQMRDLLISQKSPDPWDIFNRLDVYVEILYVGPRYEGISEIHHSALGSKFC